MSEAKLSPGHPHHILSFLQLGNPKEKQQLPLVFAERENDIKEGVPPEPTITSQTTGAEPPPTRPTGSVPEGVNSCPESGVRKELVLVIGVSSTSDSTQLSPSQPWRANAQMGQAHSDTTAGDGRRKQPPISAYTPGYATCTALEPHVRCMSVVQQMCEV